METCWECPIPVREILAHYALLAALVAVSSALMAARRQFVHAIGWMSAVVIILWTASYTFVVPQWGIGDGAVPLDPWPRRSSWLILAALDLILFLIGRIVFRWRKVGSAPA